MKHNSQGKTMFLNLKSVFGQGKNWIIHTVNTRLFGK